MGLSCGNKCIKYLFFVFNVIFFLLGIAVLGVGIYSRVEYQLDDIPSEFYDGGVVTTASNLLIAGGAIVALIGFLGCFGAVRESRCCLILYCVLTIIIFILEIAGGAYAYTHKDDLLDTMKVEVEKAFKVYGDTDTDTAKAFTKAIDLFQENLECCGVDGASDWLDTAWQLNEEKKFNKSSVVVPESCCKVKEDGCNVGGETYSVGCFAAGKTYVQDNLWLVGGVGVGIGLVQLLGIAFAIGLLCAINERKGQEA